MTLAEAGEIFAYWSENPPIHLMGQVVARMLGWKPPSVAAPTLAELAAMAPPGLSLGASDFGMPAPVLDIETLRARNNARLANRSGSM